MPYPLYWQVFQHDFLVHENSSEKLRAGRVRDLNNKHKCGQSHWNYRQGCIINSSWYFERPPAVRSKYSENSVSSVSIQLNVSSMRYSNAIFVVCIFPSPGLSAFLGLGSRKHALETRGRFKTALNRVTIYQEPQTCILSLQTTYVWHNGRRECSFFIFPKCKIYVCSPACTVTPLGLLLYTKYCALTQFKPALSSTNTDICKSMRSSEWFGVESTLLVPRTLRATLLSVYCKTHLP